MTEEEKTVVTEDTPAPQEEAPAQEPAAEQAEPKKKRGKKSDKELEELRGQLAAEQDKYLRMAAEYDNYRKRSMKERIISTTTVWRIHSPSSCPSMTTSNEPCSSRPPMRLTRKAWK